MVLTRNKKNYHQILPLIKSSGDIAWTYHFLENMQMKILLFVFW